MTTTRTAIDEIHDEVRRVADQRGWAAKVSLDPDPATPRLDFRPYTGVWVEFAYATHGGRCPDDPTQLIGPAWDWVQQGEVIGTTGTGQCGGCGQYGRGWVHSGAKQVAEVPRNSDEGGERAREAIASLADEFSKGLEKTKTAIVTSLEAQVRREHERAVRLVVEAVRTGADLEDLGLTGSELEPGSYVDTFADEPAKIVTWLDVPYDETGDEIVSLETSWTDVLRMARGPQVVG